PIVLRELEGQPVTEAARRLGWRRGRAATRLTRGRALLARRLARRGLPLPAGVLAAALAHGTVTAGVPAALVVSTVRAAGLFAAGPAAAAGVVPARVADLTGRVVRG